MKIISTIRNDYENHAASVGRIYNNNSNNSDNNTFETRKLASLLPDSWNKSLVTLNS